MDNPTAMNQIRWSKSILNGIVVLVVGFILYLIPGLVLAFRMGFDLGPKVKNSQEVSTKIGHAVSQLYSDEIWFTIAFIIITGLLVLWRSSSVAKGTGNKKLINGLIVGAVPALIGLSFVFSAGFSLIALLEIIVFIGFGLWGGYLSKQEKLPE